MCRICVFQPPKPQGPVVIRSGASANITFKNVFAHAEDFTYAVDNAMFVLAKKTERIDGKKVVQIAVNFKPDGGASTSTASKTVAGKGVPAAIAAVKSAKKDDVKEEEGKPAVLSKLYVTCPNLPPFVYYLKGSA